MIRALLFDLDGTLIDSEQVIYKAMKSVIAQYTLREPKKQDIQQVMGLGTRKMLEHFDIYEKSALNDYLSVYESLLESHVYFGDVFESLELVKNVPKAIVTNKYEYLSQKIIEKLGMSQYFSTIIGEDNVTKPKPSPDRLLLASNLLQIKTDECLMIGDSIVDIRSALEANMKSALICRNKVDLSELDAKPDYIIKSLSELQDLLKGRKGELYEV